MRVLSIGDLPSQIANAHTVFNLGTAVLCAPLVNVLVSASDKLVPEKKHKEVPEGGLDVRMLDTPGLALAHAYNEIIALAKMSFKSFGISYHCVKEADEEILTG